MKIFNRGSETYCSDIVLGERYRDPRTGVEGVATSLHFYEHACERVTLERVSDQTGQLHEEAFDAPRLRRVDAPDEPVRQQKTGGPARADGRRATPGR